MDENGNLTAQAEAGGWQVDENGELTGGVILDKEHFKNGEEWHNLGKTKWSIPDYVPDEGIEGDIVENVDLDEEPEADEAYDAIQAWWDAYRTAANAGDSGDWDAEQAAFDRLSDVFGVETENVMNRIMDRLDKENYVTDLENIPNSWWMAPDNWNGGGGLSGQDVEGLKGVPGQMAAATRAGIADGLGKVRVIMDRQAVGWLVAPTVSEYIAGEIEA